jgi:hypothetical protein
MQLMTREHMLFGRQLLPDTPPFPPTPRFGLGFLLSLHVAFGADARTGGGADAVATRAADLTEAREDRAHAAVAPSQPTWMTAV